MKLIINLASIFKGGAEQVSLSFITECRNFPENSYHVVMGPNLANQINQEDFPDNFVFHLISKRPASNVFHFLKMMHWFNKLEKEVKPDCVISTGDHGYWRPKARSVGGFNMAHFIYPESPYFKSLSAKRSLFWKLKRSIHLFFYNRLDEVLVQTEDVKIRLAKALSSEAPIHVVSNTVNAVYLNRVPSEKKLPPAGSGELRLLTVSSYYPHKNLEVIKPVVRILERKGNSNFSFILTMAEEKFQEVFGDDTTGMIKNVGPVPVKECPSLYAECDFMFLPTLLECFSASYVEAMIMEKPILTSDMSFAHTVCRDAAVYFDPLNPEDISDKLLSLSADALRQAELLRKGTLIMQSIHSPHERARKYLEICQRCILHM